jgi:hypothetical protein
LTAPANGGLYWKLQSSSPAIKAGTSQGAPTYDFDGVARPQGTSWDIGAYEFSGTTTAPVASLSSTSFTFANQTVGTSSPAQTLTLSNTGNAALSITSIAVTGTNSGDFAQTNNCGSSLAAGASCAINVTFTPTGLLVRSSTLTITDDATNGSPQTVSLSGTGI